MVTTIGNEGTVEDLLCDLVQLDHDAVSAYESAIARLEAPALRKQLAAFKADHERHIGELSRFLATLNVEAPAQGVIKQWLARGKVALWSMLGDEAILRAMQSNEGDTNTAYQRAEVYPGLPPQARDIVSHGRADERRHWEWITNALDRMAQCIRPRRRAKELSP